MELLKKNKNKYYTQNIEELNIEERVFFTEGLVANVNDYRLATDTEIKEWEEYKTQEEK